MKRVNPKEIAQFLCWLEAYCRSYGMDIEMCIENPDIIEAAYKEYEALKAKKT